MAGGFACGLSIFYEADSVLSQLCDLFTVCGKGADRADVGLVRGQQDRRSPVSVFYMTLMRSQTLIGYECLEIPMSPEAPNRVCCNTIRRYICINLYRHVGEQV